MKKIWISLISALYCGFTLGYMHFADPRTNAGALSTIGLDHPVLFALWGAGTYGVLYLLLYTMYNKQKRRGLCHGLLLPAGVGMALTVCCPFDFERHTLWLLHCIGSLAFSVLSGVAIFLCFLFSFKKGRFWQYATVFWAALMIGDLILLLIYKETGLIEATPVLAGVVLAPRFRLRVSFSFIAFLISTRSNPLCSAKRLSSEAMTAIGRLGDILSKETHVCFHVGLSPEKTC